VSSTTTPRPVSAIPSALSDWDAIAERLRGEQLVAFLDFDGTLSPLVDEPGDAALEDGTADVLHALTRRATVAVVSGRGADDVRHRVGLPGLWVAGSHGFEIVAPTGERVDHPHAGPAATALEAAAVELEDELGQVPGVRLERKHLGLTVHDRMVREDDLARVRRAAQAAGDRYDSLRITHGKRVIELRPDIDWDKGAAVDWLREQLQHDAPLAAAIYVGDDTTDEDAFGHLGPGDVTVVVTAGGAPDRLSVAEWSVTDPSEVRDLLGRLATLEPASPTPELPPDGP
jgi:alpha,alpha-trehalase